MAAQPFGVSAAPPSFVPSVIFLSMYSAPSFRSLTKMTLNSIGPSNNPWGTSLVDVPPLDFVPVSLTLQSPLQSIYVAHTSSVCEEVVIDGGKSLK